ncbi:PhzF family phenazine biosynthesis protein [Chitinispirillales bacterium ANBcel5]|uniref:PhzF family phenazine biosynthesis protein n=1 Tax=Cellulosispirillum alkaliphilum TaxID=3039283 RepID=UPI002A579547|nr:PhzF family phenazine biosynthesis protein [Chitinispirillales bacterium ANBcel5]
MKLFQVDSFTSQPFSGNPAGVCIADKEISEPTMQNIAAEINCSETAFLKRVDNGYSIRFFTPTQEVDLCGHATLASSHILFELGLEKRDAGILFHANNDDIPVNCNDGWISMGFPKDHLIDETLPVPIQSALGFSDGVVAVKKSIKMDRYLIEVDSQKRVLEANPDLPALKSSRTIVSVTSRSRENKYDFVSRFFAPHAGIPEDPVTGSAHTSLGEYWSGKLNKNSLTGFQLSKRGGEVRVDVEDKHNKIMGKAVTLFKIEPLF